MSTVGIGDQEGAPRPAVSAVQVLARLGRMLERGSGELGLAHYRMLASIAAGDQRATRLAARLALGKPAISAAVESLAVRGLLVRSESPEDHRAVRLELTDQGRAALAAAEQQMTSELGDLLRRVGDPEAVLAALGRLGQAMDERLEEALSRPKAPLPREPELTGVASAQ